MCANAGLMDSLQYRPKNWVTSATMVMNTRTKQYWKTPNQMIYIHISSVHLTCIIFQPTLNHVSPLLGVRRIPLSPPQHFLNQVNGQTQPLG